MINQFREFHIFNNDYLRLWNQVMIVMILNNMRMKFLILLLKKKVLLKYKIVNQI